MKFRRKARSLTGQLDMAPFASLFFLLLMLLLFQTYLVPPPGVKVELPVAGVPNLPATGAPWLAVAVDQVGRLYYQNQVVTEDELGRKLARRVRNSSVPLSLLLQADRRVPQETIMRLHALARRAGLREVVVATRPPLLAPGSGKRLP
jgi:biopolymer transport protein ExbD